MSVNDEFIDTITAAIQKHQDLFCIRECMVKFRDKGMNRDSMLKNLEKMRYKSDTITEDILLELMDFVVGYCSPEWSLFK